MRVQAFERQRTHLWHRAGFEPMRAAVHCVNGLSHTLYYRRMHSQGKVALVTGGSRGIGRAICLRMAQDGAQVVVNYRQGATEAAAVIREIELAGGRAIALQADVSDRAQVLEMYRRGVDALGPVDILVNNAGVFRRGDLADFDFSQLAPMRETNVDGLVHCTRAAVEGMKQKGWGRIVNVTSIAAHGTSMPGTTFYAATKAAVVVLTRRFAMELGASGITVNAIAPGFILTEMSAGLAAEAILAKTMTRRAGSTEDISHAVSFLVAPASSFITAQVLTVDGGRMDYLSHA